MGGKKNRRREEASVSLGLDVDRGGGGQRTLDKEPRGGEGRVKRRTNEKHPCGKALSHLPQLTISTASLPSPALCPR